MENNIIETIKQNDIKIADRNATQEVHSIPALNEKEREQAIQRIDKGVKRIAEALTKAENGYLSIINDLARLRSSYPSGKITINGKTYSSFKKFAMEQWSFSKSTYYYLCNVIDRFYDTVTGKVPDEIIALGFRPLLAFIAQEKQEALPDNQSNDGQDGETTNTSDGNASSADNTAGSTLDEMVEDFKEHAANHYIFDDFKSFKEEVKFLEKRNRLQILNNYKIHVSFEYVEPDNETN